jgi:hypothetical protein
MHCGRDFDAPVDKNATSGTSAVAKTIDTALDDDFRSATNDGTDTSGGTSEFDSRLQDLIDEGPGRNVDSFAGSSGKQLSGAEMVRAAVAATVDFLDADEDRRQGLVFVVAFLAWLLVSGPASSDPVALLGAIGLGLYLYTRETARETVEACAWGTGALLVAVPLLGLTAGTVPFAGAGAVTVVWSLLVGVSLLVFGIWLRRQDL